MKKVLGKEEVLLLYQQRVDEILKKMYLVLFRAQRKVDDDEYRKVLAKLEEVK